jgi:DNA polymerase-3 subunit gamma/tau
MAPQVVLEYLRSVLRTEGVGCDDGALRLLAHAARGSMRDALSLTDQAIAYGAGTIAEAAVRSMLGAVDQGHAAVLVEALAVRDGAAVLARVQQLRELGLSADGTLETMAVLLQRMAVEQAVPGALDAEDPDQQDPRRLASVMPSDETQLLYSIVLQGRAELTLMSDAYAAMTMVLLRLLAFAPGGTAAPVRVAKPSVPAATTSPPPARAAAPTELPPWVDDAPAEEPLASNGSRALRATPAPAIAVPAPPALVPTELGERWAALVAQLVQRGSVAALVRELALQAGLQRIDADQSPACWQLCVERDSLRTDALRDKLAQALAAELGEAVQLQLVAGVPGDSPARREAAERERLQHAAEATIRDDPLVRELLSQFKGARIVPGSIKPV